jgi:6-pyruvoyl-tetrahydropterin synthase
VLSDDLFFYNSIYEFNASHFNTAEEYRELEDLERDMNTGEMVAFERVLDLMRRIHGHTWRIQFEITTPTRAQPYFLADEELEGVVKRELENRNLSISPFYELGIRATIENMASYVLDMVGFIAGQRMEELKTIPWVNVTVQINEGPDHFATAQRTFFHESQAKGEMQ